MSPVKFVRSASLSAPLVPDVVAKLDGQSLVAEFSNQHKQLRE